MKLNFLVAFLSAVVPLAGCASGQRGLVLAPVGPAALSNQPEGNGTLVVYSAYDQGARFNDLPYREFYTDYQIFASGGQLLETVGDNGNSAAGPKPVKLPPGTYRIQARANGYGRVTVPVVVAAGQTTTVHLEGGAGAPKDSSLAHSNPVRLPNGEIVGWRAEPAASQGYHHEVVSEMTQGDTKFLRLVPDSEP